MMSQLFLTLAQTDQPRTWLDKLMGLSQLRWSDPGAMLGWRWALPAWVWALIILAAIGAAVWSYRHLLGARWKRITLGVMRAAILIILAALIAGPMLVLPREHIEPDWLIMLVDRSESMQIRDVPWQGGLQSRDEALRQTLLSHLPMLSPEKLGKDRHILWLGFDSGAYDIPGPTGMARPEGQSTALRSAIQQALQRAAGHPISALVVMSDGRSSQATGVDLVHQLQQQAASVIAVPLGSEKGARDLAVAQVDAPDKAFIDDPVPVSVWIESYPQDQPVDAPGLSVRLVDTLTNQVLDEKQPAAVSREQPVLLQGKSGRAGPSRWRVEIVTPQGAAEHQTPGAATGAGDSGELITENNQRDFDIELVDRQIKVLYVEGYPRWDYRYLKNMLLREKSVQSSVLLLSADRDFVQEGSAPIARFPATPEELQPYDVIIIGDVPASYFGARQLQMIQDHVATSGAGLLWLGGPRENPVSYDGTQLASLLPMMRAAGVTRLPESAGYAEVMPTSLAQSLQVLQLDETAVTADGFFWPAKLAPLRYVQAVGALKPTAEVLAQATAADGKTSPVVLRMRFGGGQALYVATDEIWRWRFGRGEIYFERFWTQLIRMLARGRLQQDDSRVSLALSSRRVDIDQPVVVSVQINDPLLAGRPLPGLKVEATTAGDEPGAPAVDVIELQARPARAGETGRQVYEATWRPGTAGRLSLRIVGEGLDGLASPRTIDVAQPEDELRQPSPDFDRLATLAQSTGGHVLPLEQFDELAGLVPNRARRTPDDIREPLWNSSLALILVVTLLTLEWIGRKMLRLT